MRYYTIEVYPTDPAIKREHPSAEVQDKEAKSLFKAMEGWDAATVLKVNVDEDGTLTIEDTLSRWDAN